MTDQEQAIITKYDLLFESRLTRVEATMDSLDKHITEVKSDLRWLMKVMFGLNASILLLIAKGFHWLPF